jgi:hypothetical protein
MIKYLVDMKENDYGVVKYDVLVNDDSFQFVSDRSLSTEEIAKFLECEVEEIAQIDFEDYE